MKRDSASGVQSATAIAPSANRNDLEQTSQRYGHRISILGLWQPGEGFEYALAQGGFKGKSYIEVMDWVAQKAAQTLADDGTHHGHRAG
jgi:hypothetical protein